MIEICKQFVGPIYAEQHWALASATHVLYLAVNNITCTAHDTRRDKTIATQTSTLHDAAFCLAPNSSPCHRYDSLLSMSDSTLFIGLQATTLQSPQTYIQSANNVCCNVNVPFLYVANVYGWNGAWDLSAISWCSETRSRILAIITIFIFIRHKGSEKHDTV